MLFLMKKHLLSISDVPPPNSRAEPPISRGFGAAGPLGARQVHQVRPRTVPHSAVDA